MMQLIRGYYWMSTSPSQCSIIFSDGNGWIECFGQRLYDLEFAFHNGWLFVGPISEPPLFVWDKVREEAKNEQRLP